MKDGITLREIGFRVLSELIRNSRISDREFRQEARRITTHRFKNQKQTGERRPHQRIHADT